MKVFGDRDIFRNINILLIEYALRSTKTPLDSLHRYEGRNAPPSNVTVFVKYHSGSQTLCTKIFAPSLEFPRHKLQRVRRYFCTGETESDDLDFTLVMSKNLIDQLYGSIDM